MPTMEPTEITNDTNDDGGTSTTHRQYANYLGIAGDMSSSSAASSSSIRGGGAINGNNNGLLVRPHEIAVYIQRPSLRFDDVLYFLTNVEPARFNFPKPPGLRLSDDAWAALQLRVDHAARDILDPHRYYAAAACVSVLITIVFYAIRPGYDRRSIHATSDGEGNGIEDDDEIYDDYFHDDLWLRNHALDDVVVAELNYLNSNLDRPMWIWRIGLFVSVILLFVSVLFIVVLMEKRNSRIDAEIIRAVEEIRPRFEDEGLGVEYRTRSSHPPGSSLLFLGRYIRPTRVVVFYYLDDRPARTANRRVGSFFSDDYQRRYFPPIPTKTAVDYATTDESRAQQTSSFSII
ncbi:hypothetical protein ACHAXA_006884 [Cyclostephanos tholiformis]|uniref:Uncharacterized protein n=1 Tax=Cyclostephanos tholiformis TaxID=382380 RepID=A0ABD3SD30_9STRA